MPRLFRGNFDFEHQLAEATCSAGSRLPSLASPKFRQAGACPTDNELPRKLKLINAKWVERLFPLMQPGNLLWLPELKLFESSRQDSFHQRSAQHQVQVIQKLDEISFSAEQIEFVPWGWSPELRTLARQQGWQAEMPDEAAVRWVNSRATSYQQEHVQGLAPPGTAMITELLQLREHLNSVSQPSRWVLKAEFGMSARERILGEGPQLNPQLENWVQKRLELTGAIFFEPWLQRVAEVSYHYQIERTGDVRFLGATHLQTDEQGRYRNNQPIDPAQDAEQLRDWKLSREVTAAFAMLAAKQGYFGPLSFDAMRYRDETGDEQERPLQDINGRYTMGRCAWERFRSECY